MIGGWRIEVWDACDCCLIDGIAARRKLGRKIRRSGDAAQDAADRQDHPADSN